MHKWLMEKAKCLKSEMECKGIDNLTKEDFEEAYFYSKILKNLMCIEKDGRIVDAMEESENEDNMRMIEMYEDYPERRGYDEYRYMRTGKYAPKGKGTYIGRRGYSEPPYYIMPEIYRDMDRASGKMYFPEYGAEAHNQMDGHSWKSRRGYMETKEMHKENTPENKELKMRELEKYAKELTEDVVEMIYDMPTDGKQMLKNAMMNIAQKIQ